MKKSNLAKLFLACGVMLSSTAVFAQDSTTILHNKDGIVLKFNGDNKGNFEVVVENNTEKDIFDVKLFSKDIKGLKLKNGGELSIGNLKAKEKKVLDKKELQFEIDKSVTEAIQNQKLVKTGIAGVSKVLIPISIAGMIGTVYVLVSDKKKSKKFLSLAISAGILGTALLGTNVSADNAYDHNENVAGKIVVNGKDYEYVGILVWNDIDKNQVEKPNSETTENENTKPNVEPEKPVEIIAEKVTVKAYTNLEDKVLIDALKNIPEGYEVSIKSKPKDLTTLGEKEATAIVSKSGKSFEVKIPVEVVKSLAYQTNYPKIRMVNQPNERTIQEVTEGFVINWKIILKDTLKSSMFKNVEVLTVPTEEELKVLGTKEIDYRITFIDGSVREYKLNTLNVVPSNSSEFSPEIKEIEIEQESELTDELLKASILNLPDQIKENEGGFYFRVESKPTTEELKVVNKYTASVRLIFGDATFKDISIPVNVITKKVAEKTIVSFDELDTVEIPYGANKDSYMSKLPKIAKANLSDGTKVDVNLKEYKGYINTWSAGESQVNLDYDLPEGVTGEKKELFVKIKVLPKPAEAQLQLDKESYYYKDNPILTLKNFPDGEVEVLENKEYDDKKLKENVEYTYDAVNKTVTINTHAILKVSGQTLSTDRTLDITVKVGTTQKMITIHYLKDKSMYPWPDRYDDVERNGIAKIEMIIDDKAEYQNIKAFVGTNPIIGAVVKDEMVDGEEKTFLSIPYESVKTFIKENKLEITIRCDGYKDQKATLNYKPESIKKQWNVEAVVNENDGTTPKGVAIYPYNGEASMKIKVTGNGITDEYLRKNLVVKIKSANEAEFTVPKSNIGAWRITNYKDLLICVPTDQMVGEIIWKKDINWEEGQDSKEGYEGRHPITKITLELEGYETKTVDFCISY